MKFFRMPGFIALHLQSVRIIFHCVGSLSTWVKKTLGRIGGTCTSDHSTMWNVTKHIDIRYVPHGMYNNLHGPWRYILRVVVNTLLSTRNNGPLVITLKCHTRLQWYIAWHYCDKSHGSDAWEWKRRGVQLGVPRAKSKSHNLRWLSSTNWGKSVWCKLNSCAVMECILQ